MVHLVSPDSLRLIESLRKILLWEDLRPKITSIHRGDGVGAQLHAAFQLVAFARAQGCEYLHPPFKATLHYNKTRDDLVDRWNSRLPMSKQFPAPSQGRVLDLDKSQPLVWGLLSCSPHTVFHSRKFRYFVDRNPNLLEDSAGVLREIWREGNQNGGPAFSDESAGYDITLHIRGGDVTKSAHPKRFVSADALVAQILFVRKRMGQKHIRVQVVGEQLPTMLVSKLPEIDWHHEPTDDPIEAFTALVCSRRLIVAKSSFSFVAAILSEAEVFYTPFWHPPLPSWIPLPSAED